MRSGRKTVIGLVLAVFAAVLTVFPASAARAVTVQQGTLADVRKAEKVTGKWEKWEYGYKFRTDEGKLLRNKWIKLNSGIYYVGIYGYRLKGLIKYQDNLYYLGQNGRLKTGWIKADQQAYYARSNGKLAVGKVKIGDNVYYFDKKTGERQSGWVSIDKSWYYFKPGLGRMQRSCWIKTDGKYYYVSKYGRRQVSRWLTLDGKKYYLGADGARLTGTQYINKKGYFFKENGVYDPAIKVAPPIDPSGKMVALTFDDGPGQYTNRLLDCLEKNEARATFFMVGSNVPHYKSAVKRMANMGCELGGHSYDHAAFTTLSYSGMRSQVTSTRQKIYQACGKYPTVFRLPYGDGYNNSTVLSALQMPSIYWSIDTMDWANTGNPQHTINEVLNSVRSGDIVLMHDIHRSSVVAAETIIPALKARGYQLVTVSQLAQYKGHTTLRSGKTYFSFR